MVDPATSKLTDPRPPLAELRPWRLPDGTPKGRQAPARRGPNAAYIHVPFCQHHCGYCNFTVLSGRDDLAGQYLVAIERELAALGAPRPIETLFLGGGTPTHLAPVELDALLATVRRWFTLGAGYEFTVEANPADVTPAIVAILQRAGVTRLSLGAQSFAAEKLARLERDHKPTDIARAVALVRDAGLHVSLDLIFAAPGESLAGWRDDLAQAIALRPEHVSTYGLTFERGTTFWGRLARGELARADEETERAMYELAIDRLSSAGFEHYEVSNFARPAHRCRHNEVYWAGEEYFAAGPGGASTLTVGARRITAARRPGCGACWPASPRLLSRKCSAPKTGPANRWCSACADWPASGEKSSPRALAMRSTLWLTTYWPDSSPTACCPTMAAPSA